MQDVISVDGAAEEAHFSKLVGKGDEMVVVRREALIREDEVADALDPELESELRQRLAKLFGSVTSLPAPIATRALGDDDAETEAEQVFEFRLFEGGPRKIILQEEEGMGDGGFVAMRDPRIFVVARAEGERKAAFERAAIDGEEILKGATKRAWGLEVPWRVKVVRAPGKPAWKSHDVEVSIQVVDTDTKRKKPGKKQRIILRGRHKKAEEIARRKKAEEASKEEAEREKKTRKNRDKKLKKRMKEKAGKANGGAVVEGVDNTTTDAKD